jgi:hypothetical protein
VSWELWETWDAIGPWVVPSIAGLVVLGALHYLSTLTEDYHFKRKEQR